MKVSFYSNREYLLRMLWALISPLWFMSPRIFWFWRRFLLVLFGAKVSCGLKIYPSSVVKQPWKLTIKSNCTIGWNTYIYCLGEITIGSGAVISQGVHLCSGTHDYRNKRFPLVAKNILIGDNAWVAADAFIGPGVIVGDFAVVAARSVVVKDILPYNIVGGNPSSVIGYRDEV